MEGVRRWTCHLFCRVDLLVLTGVMEEHIGTYSAEDDSNTFPPKYRYLPTCGDASSIAARNRPTCVIRWSLCYLAGIWSSHSTFM
jgi:hypothetical protein